MPVRRRRRHARSPRDIAQVAWPGGGVEHHPSHGEWVAVLRAAGFVVDALHELLAPADAHVPEYYDIATLAWATRWPAEDVWVARRA